MHGIFPFGSKQAQNETDADFMLMEFETDRFVEIREEELLELTNSGREKLKRA